ncbi:ligase-associated DNA damage response endonuclease PdeM [Variovorax dokdonensis]|uniref:Ligase-associated DNA damage response endonuclease PdeM n=1 Tax=Variovorax dokdonensis TaxID=344883 RepID=A0ABT7NGA8_9BURK|nr:ligase-associated DNA damage response endonuclease PdeM [Variovorax dokdonensis]MDM0046915.1 ligase-associated DNA damage response endonuclease PdeM [Variovorax dokdonensis]
MTTHFVQGGDPQHNAVSTAFETDWGGERVHLLPERALWWPRGGVLFVADLHLGKAASFRALGQPVPGGTTAINLARLSELVARHGATQMVFLGDFLHAAAARTPSLLAALAEWRERHAQLTCTLVRGNHDSHAGDPPSDLNVAIVDEPWLLGPFACCHHPQTHATHFVLAGHLHPACSLHGRGRDSLRMPCFLQEGGQAVLPAFGEFTGGLHVPAAPGRRRYAVGADAVWALPSVAG